MLSVVLYVLFRKEGISSKVVLELVEITVQRPRHVGLSYRLSDLLLVCVVDLFGVEGIHQPLLTAYSCCGREES